MNERSLTKNEQLDWITIFIVVSLLSMGVTNLYSAAFNPDRPFLFDLGALYGKQIMWIGLGTFMGLVVSLIDSNFIRRLAPLAFIVVFILLIFVLFTDPINGARSWLGVGSFGIQPSEFSKLSTALIIAYFISEGRINRVSGKTAIIVLTILFTTMVLILIQNDTGTFLVFTAFFFVLYREGITLDPVILFIFNNLLGFRLKKTWVGVHFIPMLFVIIFFAIITLYFTESVHRFYFLPAYDVPGWVLMIVILSVIAAIVILFVLNFISQRVRRRALSISIITYFVAVACVGLISYTYLNVLQSHQKDRIDLWLGKIEDKDGKDYNRNRALAAVGSGGFSGRGYQDAILASPRAQHVPESETDFIFSVFAEEWGFGGTIILVFLFTFLLIRILIIAERQRSRFARIYAYSVMMIFFYHFAINVGMNIGIIPVIGIPLPFFSYGGYSMMSFLTMIFILLKLDSQRKEVL
jgi:rod shape determining protein RodA